MEPLWRPADAICGNQQQMEQLQNGVVERKEHGDIRNVPAASAEPFVKINYAYRHATDGDAADVINRLVDDYARQHNVQNEPIT